MSVHTVSVYLVDKAYGGPEEGGWWYEYGIPQDYSEFVQLRETFVNLEEAERYRVNLQVLLDQQYNRYRPDINSVLSDGVFRVVIDTDCDPAEYPSTKPRYE